MTLAVLPLLPALAAVIVIAARGRPRMLGPLAVGALAATVALGLWAAGSQPEAVYRWGPSIELRLAVEGFARTMVVLVPLVAAPIVAYAAATETVGRTRLLASMLAFVAAMLVLVTAADFLTLLIAWEIVGALSWLLIGHGWRDPENPRAAAQAFLTTRIGDLGLYVAAGATFAASGSFDYAAVGTLGSPARELVAGGVLLAAAAKSAQVPFSTWLFAAMAGPTPVSALLHSATLVAAGAYLLIRLAPALEPVAWFLPAVALVGLTTAIAGGIVATFQTQAKRALAASTSAQYGLMFLAVGAGFPAAAGVQLVAHAAFKSLLFLGAGIAIHATGTGRLDALRLGRVLPRVAALSAIGALALAAVPPLGGAWTKEQVLAGAAEASVWFAIGGLAAGFLTALYAARYQLLVWGPADRSSETPRIVSVPGLVEVGGMAVLAAVTILLSLLWLPGAGPIARDLGAGRLPEGAPIEALAGLAVVAAGLTTAGWLWRRGALVDLGLAPGAQSAAADWLGLPTATRALIVLPVVGLSHLLARIDDRVVDAGVRRAAWLANVVSRLFSRRAEFAIDGVVRGVARATMLTADLSRVTDDRGVDGAVEATGRGVGLAGHQSRRLQSGLSHQYYVLVAGGLAIIAAILVVFR